MSFKLVAAIYKTPWLIEPNNGVAYYDSWKAREAANLPFRSYHDDDDDEEEEPKAVDPQKKFFANSSVKYAPLSYRQSLDFTGFEGASVAVITVDGPLMKHDFCGWYGTASLATFVRLAEQTESVKEIVLLIDSPGGSVDGTSSFADVVKSCSKQTTAIVSGMCCSAAYWIASACDKIILTSKTDMIGSIGTMFRIVSYNEYYKKEGIVIHTFTATQSKDKNKAFTEAEKGNGAMLIKELLDPMNDQFVGAVKENRGDKLSKEEDVLTGKVYVGNDGVLYGLADEIKSMDAALDEIVARNTSIQSPTKIYNMTAWQKFLALIGFKATETSKPEDIKLTEDHMTSIEAVITERDTLQAKVTKLEGEVSAANTAKKTAEEALATANTKITGLEAKVVKLKAEDGTPGATAPAGDKDKFPKAEDDMSQFETSWDREARMLREQSNG